MGAARGRRGQTGCDQDEESPKGCGAWRGTMGRAL